MGGEFGEMSEEVRGLRSTNRLLQNSHGYVKFSIGNGVAKEPTHDLWTWIMVWGLREGVRVLGGGVKEGKIGTTVIAWSIKYNLKICVKIK